MPGRKKNDSGESTNGNAVNSNFPTLTEGESRLLIGIMLNSPRPSPDWKAVAVTIGSASAGSAQKRFQNLAQKLNLYGKGNANGGGNGDATGTAPATPRTATKKSTTTRTPRVGKKAAGIPVSTPITPATSVSVDHNDETPVKKRKVDDIKSEEEDEAGDLGFGMLPMGYTESQFAFEVSGSDDGFGEA